MEVFWIQNRLVWSVVSFLVHVLTCLQRLLRRSNIKTGIGGAGNRVLCRVTVKPYPSGPDNFFLSNFKLAPLVRVSQQTESISGPL